MRNKFQTHRNILNKNTYMLKFLAILVRKSDNASLRNLLYNSFNEHEIREGCKPSYKNHPCLWLITWDPTQPVATRPLAIQKDGTWYTYGWDLTKNICEVFGQNGYIRSTYAYTPFGSVTANGDVIQPIQWSSEYYDNELALVYYNYRHYNPTDGRWINRDPITEQGGWNLYGFVGNRLINYLDNLGKELITYQFPREHRPLKYNSEAVTMIENAEEIDKKLQIDYRVTKNINKFCCNVSFILETTFRIGLYWPNINDKISGYTSNGVATILAHENRRLSVYQKADIAYIKVPLQYYYKLYSESNSYEKAKHILDAYIQKIHHIAMDMFLKYVTLEQKLISKETNKNNFIRTKAGLIDGIKKSHKINEPQKLIPLPLPSNIFQKK